MFSPKQRRAVDAYGRKIDLSGAVLLGEKHSKVRNQLTGRVLPCCWTDCDREGSTQYEVKVPHDTPRWRDPVTGNQEMLVYIFCSAQHKEYWITGLAQR